eukprot:12305-Heterococcus_DN1.PRE.1
MITMKLRLAVGAILLLATLYIPFTACPHHCLRTPAKLSAVVVSKAQYYRPRCLVLLSQPLRCC